MQTSSLKEILKESERITKKKKRKKLIQMEEAGCKK